MKIRLTSAFAISLFLPTIALFNIGPSTGFQISTLLGIMYLLKSTNFTLIKKFELWYFSLISIIIIQVLVFSFVGSDSSVYYKNLIHILSSLLMIRVGFIIGKKDLNLFAEYYYIGALISAIFGIFQFIFWNILSIDFTPLRGINNSNSFANAGLTENIIDFGRSFAFTPEPSMFSLLLIPAFFIALHKSSKVGITLIIAGLLCSQSVTSLIIIPLLIFQFTRSTKLIYLLIFISIVFASYKINNFSPSDVSLHNVSTDSSLIQRISNLGNNGSFLSRLNSVISSIELIESSPLLGMGYTELLNEKIRHNAILGIEENTGINSLFILISVVFGLPFSAILAIPILLILKKINSNFYSLLFFSMVIPSFISLGYYSFYLPWVGLGLSASISFSKLNNKTPTINGEFKTRSASY